MKRFVGFLLTFLGGVVVALNLSLLLPRNPDYEASWLNVCVATAIAVNGAFMGKSITADRQLLEQARDALRRALCHMDDDRGTQRAEDRGTVYETLAALNKRLGERE